VALIIGEDEVDANTVVVKPMRGGDQQTIPRSELIAHLSETLSQETGTHD
jgi:histidyl-tRNA synthetase